MSESHASTSHESGPKTELQQRAEAAGANMGMAWIAAIGLAVISTLLLIATKWF